MKVLHVHSTQEMSTSMRNKSPNQGLKFHQTVTTTHTYDYVPSHLWEMDGSVCFVGQKGESPNNTMEERPRNKGPFPQVTIVPTARRTAPRSELHACASGDCFLVAYSSGLCVLCKLGVTPSSIQ